MRGLLLVPVFAGCAAASPTVAATEQADTACADGATVRGIDVSYYEDSIDWPTVHAAGIDWAIVRVSDGLQFIDPKFPAYWAGARAAGVLRGAYQFFRPAQDPIAQADLLLDKMGPLQAGDLPPVIDVETSGGLTTDQVAAAVRAWVDHVEAAIGRPPIIYAGLYSWHDLTGSADMATYPLWVAQYTSAPCPNIPLPWTRWLMWQTGAGHVDGVPGDQLDLDVFNGTIDDLRAFSVAGACGDSVCSGDETVATCAADCRPCGSIAPGGGEVDDGDACFTGGGPAEFLRPVADAGEQGDLIWTHATANADEVSSGDWSLYFEAGGTYRVEVYTDGAYAQSHRAAYAVEASGVRTLVTIDQAAVDGWQTLGEFAFAPGGGQRVHLGDNTGEPAAENLNVVFDAVRLTRVDEPAEDGGGCATTQGGTSWLVTIALAALTERLSRRRRVLRSPRCD